MRAGGTLPGLAWRRRGLPIGQRPLAERTGSPLRFRRLVAAWLIAAALLGGVASPAASATGPAPLAQTPADSLSGESRPPPGSVRMDVRAGFDGAGRLGGWLPLEVELVNEGAEVRADVQVAVQRAGGRGGFTSVPTIYTLPVVLPRLSHKRFTMEVNLPTVSNKITARLVRAGAAGDETLGEQEISLSRVPLGDYFCGVLARDASAYDFLAALDLPPPIRRIRTAPLEPATIPARAQLLGSFDCLILDNAATGQLRQEQLDALQVWVGTGGLLIAVGGPTWQSTLGPLPPGLLPVEPTGLTSSDTLAGLGTLLEVPLDEPGPWLLTQARPRVDRGARVVAAENGVPLVVAAKRGEGTVMYLAFEPTSRGLRGWAGSDQLWKFLVTHAPVDNGVGSALVRPYLRWGVVPRVGMADFSGHPKAGLDWLWALVAGYGLLTGGSLFVLGRRGFVGGSVLAALGLTAGASVLAFGLARQRAEPDVALTRLSVIRPIEAGESSAAYTHEYLSLLAKRDGTFSFALPESALAQGLFFPFPRPSDESDRAWPFRVGQGARPSLDRLALTQGQLATAQLDGQLRQAPGVQADLRVENDLLSGLLSNRTGGRLSDAYLIIENQVVPLGTLERDQAQQVDVPLARRAQAGSVSPSSLVEKLTPPGSSSRPGAAARRDALQSLFTTRFLSGQMELRGPTLIGWLDAAPNAPVPMGGVRMSLVELALLVQPLQPRLPRGFEGEVPAAAMNRRDLGSRGGASSDREQYTVAPGESVTLQFTMPPAEGRFALEQLRLNVEGRQVGRTLRGRLVPFTISLYNWRAAEWQAWDVQAGSSTVPDGERYLSAAGDVRLRYTLDSGLAGTIRETQLTRLDATPVGVVR